MVLGQFTDRDDALAAVDELLAPGTAARLLVVFGVTGQGKTRLLEQLAELHAGPYRPQLVDLQQVVKSGGAQPGPAGVDDLAVLLLRDVGAALARQARWWQRPGALRRQAGEIGTDPPPPSVQLRQKATSRAQVVGSPQTVVVGGPTVDTVRRGAWIAQAADLARRLRRRRLLLVDTCEWMTAFDEPSPAADRTAGISPWFLRQVLPALFDAAPRLKVVLAGWDRLDLDARRLHALPAHELTGWTAGHTWAFLASAGVDDPTVAELVHQAGDGLPLLAAVVAAEAGKWHDADGRVDTAALTGLIRDRPAARWVPEMILARLTPAQRDEVTAAAVLRTVTAPALHALLPDHRAGPGWFDRLTGRNVLQELPDTTPGGRRWRMHGQVRRWLLDHLAGADALAPAGGQRLPTLHDRAAGYFTDLAARDPDTWSAEVAYHRFALGDDTPAADWQHRILTAAHAAHAGQTATVTALADVALAPEQQQTVRTRLPAVAAAALACSAWLAHQRGEFADAEHYAVDAAGLYRQVEAPAGQAWAWQLAGQAAWAGWQWTRATDHWRQALTHAGPAGQLAVLAALAEATLGCGDLPAARTLVDQARTLLDRQSDPASEPAGARDPVAPPAVPLASTVPAERLPARLALLAADTALRTADWPQTDLLLDQADRHAAHPDEQADLLRLRAELALAHDQPPQAARLADQASAALTTAGDNPALRSAVLLTQAAAARRMSTYGPAPTVRPPLLPGDQPTRTLSLTDATEARHQQDLAHRYAGTALDLATDTGNRRARARALHALGDHDQALALFEQIGDRLGRADALSGLGDTARLRWDYAGADRHGSAALALFEQIGDRRGRADALRGLGETARLRGDYAGADRHYSAAVALCEQIGDRRGRAYALSGLGETARLRGDYAGADRHYSAAVALCEQIGDRYGRAYVLRGLGDTARLRDDYDQARARLAQAADLFDALGLTDLAHDTRRRIPST